MATNPNQSTYDAAQIQMLRGLEAVRENMGMYLGGQDTSALHHLVYEVVDNSVDEALAGYCDTIIVEMRTDGSIAVVDNGRGIPTDIHPVEGRSALEIVLTELHAGGKFKGSQGYKVSGGLHGVGVSAVNAVSEFLRAEVKRDGKLWAQDFRLGMPQAPVHQVGDAEGTGTTIIFKPDAQLFTTVEFNYRTLSNRLRDMAYLNKSLRFKLVDYNNDREVTYYFDGGIVSFVRHLTREKGPLLAQPFYVEKPHENVNVEIAMQYTGDFNENLLAFTNNIANPDGGTHVTGYRAALTRTINAYGRSKGLLKEGDTLSGEDVREGLTAIISIKLFRPQFESQTKSKLATPEAKTAVETVLNEALSGFLDENPNEARRIIEKSLLASRARDAARKARDLVQRKGALEGFALPGKLADCSDKEPAHCEIFIVEGDSAGGSAKQGRDRRFQAILPLRGKILNVEKSRLDKMLANNEVRALITALGTGIGETFDISRLRYHRILIMSVAGDEPTLIRNGQGHTEFVRIGEFIDQCIAGQRQASEYEVISFDQKRNLARFRPLKAVMRHANHEPMYKLSTRYGRSVKVTASHSVFVLENGQPVLKKGNQIKLGDQLVASRRIPRPAIQPREIDLIKLFAEAGLIDNLYLRGESVRSIAAQRVLNNVSQPEQWNEARISLHTAAWERLVEYRQAHGLSQKMVAQRLGVKQAITISQWERGMLRPIQSQFDNYLATIGWEEPISYELVPSKIERLLLQDDSSGNARWREVSNYKAFASFNNDELDLLDRDVELVPQAHDDRAFPRMLAITPELLWFLGWFTAEGSLSKHQVSLSLGQKDAAFFAELKTTIEQLFGETPRFYQSPDNGGIKCYFHSVLAACLIRALGLGAVAHQKQVPDMLFSLSSDLQRSYLEGYFLGDGTLSDSSISMTTNSPELKDGLLYVFGQLGIFAGVSNIKPNLPADVPIQTVHDYYNIAISGKQQLEQLRSVWQRHHLAAKVEAHLAKPTTKAQAFTPISDDMVGLEVLAVEELAPTGEFVYDFSVEEDENFLCGTGGLYAHNTDADVDGSHIRTLLLTFFFRHMRDLITNGHLYVAQPPLFRVQHGKAYKYVYDEATRDEYIRSLPAGTKVIVQRFKGLGEMNPDQLWDTTLNPGNRMILQVTIEDALAADETFSMLMGEIVLPRKRFIQTHAADVKNLDV
ncbi:ATP-binding protein [Herpetosiphon sp. NSE202]|uniref:ATP-binding protein n=1 Tax=Herpetosiphon sp. NSE202 TaxID=3351349 RepID=UPI00363649FA